MYRDYPNHMREEYRKYRFSEELIEHLAEGLAKAGLPIPDDRRGQRNPEGESGGHGNPRQTQG
jgi:hypothetical protein